MVAARVGAVRGAWLVAHLGLTAVCAFVFMQVFYETRLGSWLVEQLPSGLVARYVDWYGRADGEAGQDAELVAFSVLSLLLALIVASTLAFVVAKVLRRRA